LWVSLFNIRPLVSDTESPVRQQAFPQTLEFSQLLIAVDLSGTCSIGCSFSSRSTLSRDSFLAASARGMDVL